MTEELVETVANADGLSSKLNLARAIVVAACGGAAAYAAKVGADKGFVKGVAIWTARAASRS